MARNIEIKARVPSLPSLTQIAIDLGARHTGRLVQSDTYFHVRSGRLKLREFQDQPAELIWYDRPNTEEPKASDYLRVPVTDAQALKQAISAAWGVLAVVHKRRDVYLWQNVRIHLDDVDRLGAFLEFESVLDANHDDRSGRRQVAWLCDRFRIAPSDFLSYSYVDLLLAEAGDGG